MSQVVHASNNLISFFFSFRLFLMTARTHGKIETKLPERGMLNQNLKQQITEALQLLRDITSKKRADVDEFAELKLAN